MTILQVLAVVSLLPTFLEGFIKFIFWAFVDSPTGGDDLNWWLWLPAYLYILRFVALLYGVGPVLMSGKEEETIVGNPCLPITLLVVGVYRIICLIGKVCYDHVDLLDSFPWTKNRYSMEVHDNSSVWLMLLFLLICIGDFMLVGFGAAWAGLNNSAGAMRRQEEEDDDLLSD